MKTLTYRELVNGGYRITKVGANTMHDAKPATRITVTRNGKTEQALLVGQYINRLVPSGRTK